MWWAYWIHVYIYQLYEVFWAYGDELDTLPWPLNYFALPFWGIANRFHKLAGYAGAFRKWVDATQLIITTVLTWEGIKKLILEWLPDLEEGITWFGDWWTSVKVKVVEWWEVTLVFVKGLITIASEALEELISEVADAIDTLTTAWHTFTSTVLPTLAKLTDVDDLIASKLKEWFPFYDDLVSLWEEIKLFFVSPLDWLEAKFTDWFLGPEG